MDKDIAVFLGIIVVAFSFFFFNIIPYWLVLIAVIGAGFFIMYSPFTQAERMQNNKED